MSQDLQPIWIERVNEIPSVAEEIRLPKTESGVPQDREWCEVVIDGERRRVRFHDYNELYEVPGLYEGLFYETLQCCSPSVVAYLLADLLGEFGGDPGELRVLDVGAGNGMVGDELKVLGVPTIVGIDIIPEAKMAALRDRPGVYDGYHVVDLTDLPEVVEEKLRRRHFNCLTTVAALGFGDIPPQAFLKALDVIETPAWLAFNIKESFLHEDDDTGFCRLIRRLGRERVI